ncbi:conserved hypothetical protein [Luminiphilus syltensis NOR5-1B]|uniref:DUF2069 domain-containing protein n=1 Tax=Luminiphilus syltensis NOR5-1B TaxID=565045 RepID=B8KQB9_9GAMM|nr:DUF2069 domain-containing protein [Luminiphilus syltensis]EED35582.1 conserved hypothetical protein [Luminiphilus syltensis NOR5-1B]
MSEYRRGKLTASLWALLWVLWLLLALQQVWDVARFDAPWPLWVLRLLPLVLFMPGVGRDSLRSVVWLSFVLLFYFVSAVESIFAQPKAPTAILGITTVVLLFCVATLYIRFRGREKRALDQDNAEGQGHD